MFQKCTAKEARPGTEVLGIPTQIKVFQILVHLISGST